MVEIATPFSHLFKDESQRDSIVALSDILELRHPEQVNSAVLPYMFHSELSLVHEWSDAHRSSFSFTSCREEFRLISFHIESRYKSNRLHDGAYHGIGKPYSSKEMMKNARKNVAFLKRKFGKKFPVLVENNNDLNTDAYHTVTDGAFISRIVEENGIYLLWDMAHSKITAINREINHEMYLKTLPLERCLQIHLSGYRKSKGFAYDAHAPLKNEDWAFLAQKMQWLPMLKYVTIEYYKDFLRLEDQLLKLRQLLDTEQRGQIEKKLQKP